MDKNMVINQGYKIIFEALEKNKDMKHMVEEMACELCVSIVVIDTYGECLVYSDGVDCRKEEETLHREYTIWMQMMEQYYAKEIAHIDIEEQKIIKCNKQQVLVLGGIFVKNNVEGFCITYHSDEKYACQLNQLICRALVLGYGRKEKVYGVKDAGIRQILGKILLGSAERQGDNMPRISDEAYETYASSPFVAARIEQGNIGIINFWELRCQLNKVFPDMISYIEDKCIKILFVNQDAKEPEQIYKKLKKYLKGGNCVCAVSEQFENRERIIKKDQILKRIIQIGKKIDEGNNFFTEYDLYMEFVCSYAYEKIGISSCFDKELTILEQEDFEKGTEFYKSLKEYLLMGNNVNMAAKRLFIHRNTMVYRLAKIQEMLQLDVNDPEVAKRLMISMILREFSLE